MPTSQPRRLGQWFILMLAAALGLVVPACQAAAEAEPSELPEPPAKYSAIRQLEELFRRPATETPAQPIPPPPDTPITLTIVPGPDGQSTMIYRCRFVKAGVLTDALESIVSNAGMVETVDAQNLVVIKDLAEKGDELRQALLALDVRSPQIMVEAKVVEVFLDEGMEREMQATYSEYDAKENLTYTFGDINLGDPSPNPLPGQGGLTDFYPYSMGRAGGDWERFRLFVRWLEHARDVRILSAPNLIVDLGTTANIITGEEIPIQSSQVVGGAVSTSIEFKRIGVKLNVTPELINPHSVRLMVNPDVSTVTRFVTFQQSGVTFNNPIIAIRNIRTTLTAEDGEIIMLGGLYSSEEITSVRQPPLVKAIPVLNDLLSSKHRSKVLTQLVFLLKVRILGGSSPGGQTFYDPEQTAREIRDTGRIIKGSPVIFPRGKGEDDDPSAPEAEADPATR